MIQIRHLHKQFENKIIFNDFNLDVQNGECLAIIGKSGCGKTTLLNMIGLLDTAYQGEIIIDGTSLRTLRSSKRQDFIRQHINYLFQNYALIDNETVYHNLALALYYTKWTKKEKHLAIENVLHNLNLEHCEQSKIYTLSGGEQQRVSLARTILKQGDIILADEPTGNLDPINRDIVLKSLFQLHQIGKTVLVVTHDAYVASQCEKVLQLG